MPMMTGAPAFTGAALWFLGKPTAAGMHTGTLAFIATTPGSYQYLCPVPGHAQEGMAGAFTLRRPERDAVCLYCGLCTWQQHEVAAVVEPCFPEDALDVSCGRRWGNLKGLGYFPVGNEAPAEQVKNLLLSGCEARLPRRGV
jgi:hypothetical protein